MLIATKFRIAEYSRVPNKRDGWNKCDVRTFSLKINKHDGPNNRDGRKFWKVFLYFFGRKLKISQQIFQYRGVY